jgi:hypothetical protein
VFRITTVGYLNPSYDSEIDSIANRRMEAVFLEHTYRMTHEDSVQYRQIAVLGLQLDVRGAAVENNKRQLLNVGLYGSFQD